VKSAPRGPITRVMNAGTVAREPSAASAVAIARQPIHDRGRRVVGYELLFRDAAGGEGHDEERATTSVIVETFTGIGVEAIAGALPAHVRVSRRFLLELHAFALPSERVVLEVPNPDPAEGALVAVLERLAEQRYRVSLACDPRGPVPTPLIALADSVKLDVRGLGATEIVAAAERFGRATATLLAAGVDTPRCGSSAATPASTASKASSSAPPTSCRRRRCRARGSSSCARSPASTRTGRRSSSWRSWSRATSRSATGCSAT
jgi:hypothetical protein